MAYRSIPGSRPVTSEEHRPRFAPCKRCGVMRRADGGPNKNGNKRTGLCKDCLGNMSATEKEAWKR